MIPNNDSGRPVLVFGAGGHGKCVAEALLRSSPDSLLGFLDDHPETSPDQMLGRPVLGTLSDAAKRYPDVDTRPPVVVAVGNNRIRQKIASRLVDAGFGSCRVYHPSAVVCGGASIGIGAMLMPHSTVCTDAIVGRHVIINTNASVDHDCSIGDFVHVAPGAHLGGEVTIGTGSFLGIGVSVLPGICIGEWTTVGAGAVVTRDVPEGQTVVGVPARELRRDAR